MANTLTFANLTLTDAEIYGGISFLADLNAGDEFTVGNTASASVSFETETQLPLYSKDATNGTFTWTQDSTNRGRYYITEVTKSGGKYTVTAYDGMILLETGISALGAVTYPATVSDLADAIETYSGYTITGTLNNGSLTCEGLDDTLTVRQLLGYIAAISGASVKLNASGELCLMYYTDSGITLTASDYKEIETADYVCSAIDCVKLVGSDGIVTATAGTGSNTLYVSGNPFTDSATNTNAQTILSVVGGITYKPLTCSLFSEEGLEVGTGATFGTDYTLVMSIEASTESGATVSSVGSDSRSEYNSDLDPKIYEAVSVAKAVIKGQYEQAIEEATELIRGGMGGYVVAVVNGDGQPIELLITDNINLRQAVNVWRWNQNGLAHSSNGYNGPFTDVAITADGKINASMILTGALTANLITAGTITDASGKNSWNLDTGVFTTEQGNVGGYTIDSDGFYAVDNSGNWKNELRIINSTDGSPEIVLRRSNPNGASGIDITPSGITFYSGDDEQSLAPYEYFRTVILNNYPALNIGRSNTTGVFFGDPSFDYPISFSLPVTIGNDSRKNFLEVVGSINVVSGAEYKLGDAPLLAGGRVNFGSIATGTYSDQTITFDTAFYNVPHVTACLSTSGTAANIGNVSVSVFSISRTGCTIRVFNNRGGALSPAVEWIAVGV